MGESLFISFAAVVCQPQEKFCPSCAAVIRAEPFLIDDCSLTVIGNGSFVVSEVCFYAPQDTVVGSNVWMSPVRGVQCLGDLQCPSSVPNRYTSMI